MKWTAALPLFFACLAAAWAAPATRPFEDYQVILDRKPFGAPPDRSMESERVIPVGESFAAQMVLSGIYELDDGNLRVAITDKKDNSYFSLMVGEKDGASGIELLDADYEKEEATLQKGEETVVLSMKNPTGGQVLSTSERQEKVKEATARRMSYAERRRMRQLERSKPVEVPKPMYTGEELETHLQEYQMEVIRQGMPPLPVQLTPERDAQLVAEGYLPPVDEEGNEVLPEEGQEGEEEYYEE